MPILSHVERRAMEAVCKEFFPEGIPEGFSEDFQQDFQQAFQKGYQQGLQEGLQEGLQNCRKMVLTVLNARFKPVPAEVIDQINQISDYETLQQLLKQGLSIGSLAEYEEVLASIMTDH